MRSLTPILLGMTLFAGVSSQALAAPEEVVSAPSIADPAPAALAPEELDALSGGDAVEVNVLNNQQLTATSSGNTVTAGVISSGDVTFSGEALSGFSGIGNFVVNTGANNVLQGSISVNIVGAPGA